MYLLNNVFTSQYGETVTVLQLLTKFKMSLTEIDGFLNEYGNRINSVEFKNVTQQQEIDILKSQVQTLQTNVSNLQLTVGDYLLRFSDLDMQLGVINGKIDTNTTDITSLNGSVSSIQTSITNINNQISIINNQISGIDTRVDIALSAISDLNDGVSTINNTLSTHTSAINNLTNSVLDLTSLVNNLQSSLVSINESITFINNQISAINTSIGNINDNIDALELLVQNGGDCLHLESVNSFENSVTILHPTTIYNLWEYPTNADSDKTLVNIQTSFAIGSDTTSMTIYTPNGSFLISSISAGVVSPVTLNIDFMYKISNNIITYYGICTLCINGKYPNIRVFSSSTNYPNKGDKSFPLDNPNLGISFSTATAYLQPHVKISKYKLGG